MKYAGLIHAALGGLLLIAGPTAKAQDSGVLRQGYSECVKKMAKLNLEHGIGGTTGVAEADKLRCACTIGAAAVERQLRRKFSDEKLEITSGMCGRAYRADVDR